MSEANARKLIVEGVVIVLSILLAFAIDAWWSERQERIEEAEILLGLKQEFTDTRIVLEQQISKHSIMLQAIRELLVATDREAWSPADMTIDEALALLMSPPTTDLGNGVLDALINAGRIELLSNKRLRVMLAGWRGVFNEVYDDEVMNRDLMLNQVLPYLIRWGVPLSRPLSNFGGDWPISGKSISDDPDGLLRLLSDPEFATIVQARFGFLSHTTGEYQTALEEIDRILKEIDNSIPE